jgi:hypothetical protein
MWCFLSAPTSHLSPMFNIPSSLYIRTPKRDFKKSRKLKQTGKKKSARAIHF